MRKLANTQSFITHKNPHQRYTVFAISLQNVYEVRHYKPSWNSSVVVLSMYFCCFLLEVLKATCWLFALLTSYLCMAINVLLAKVLDAVCALVCFCVLLSLSATRLFFAQHESALWSRHFSRNRNTGIFVWFHTGGTDVSPGWRLCVWPLNQPQVLTTTLHSFCCKHSMKRAVTLCPARGGTWKTAGMRAVMELDVKHCTATLQERSCSLYRCRAHNCVSGATCKV